MLKTNKRALFIAAGLVLAVLVLIMGREPATEPDALPGKLRKDNYAGLKKKALSVLPLSPIPNLPEGLSDPFKSVSSGIPHAVKPKTEGVKRNFQLKGIMNNNESLFAIVVDESGTSHVLNVGETFNGVMVLSITPGRVTLKDSYGTFTLLQQ
jgi:type II secretory pathway component PulC